MSWSLYTALTARNRAIEAIIALFALLWASLVLSYALRGTGPLIWAGVPEDAQWHAPTIMLGACLVHMAGTVLIRPRPLPAIMRAVAMMVMAVMFAALAYRGLGQSAAPTYAFIAATCMAGAFNAARDARYARELSRAP